MTLLLPRPADFSHLSCPGGWARPSTFEYTAESQVPSIFVCLFIPSKSTVLLLLRSSFPYLTLVSTIDHHCSAVASTSRSKTNGNIAASNPFPSIQPVAIALRPAVQSLYFIPGNTRCPSYVADCTCSSDSLYHTTQSEPRLEKLRRESQAPLKCFTPFKLRLLPTPMLLLPRITRRPAASLLLRTLVKNVGDER